MNTVRRVTKLSWWEVKTFNQCPLAWDFLYLQRKKGRQPQYMIFGKAVHKAMEVFVEDFYETKRDFALAVSNATTAFDAIYAFEGPNVNKWLPIGKKVVEGLCNWTQEHEIEPVVSEPWLSKRVTRNYTYLFTFRGKADLLAKVDGVMTVIDWKTSTSGYENESSLEDVRQLGCYRLLTDSTYVQQAFVVGMKPGGEVHWKPMRVTDEQLKDLRAWIAGIHYKMERMKHLTGVYDSDICRWCLAQPEFCEGASNVHY